MQEITTWAEVLSLGFSAIVSGCTTMSEEYAHIVKTLTRMGTDLLCRPNKKGKNTTTSTKLYKTENNAYIADTPGFSTFDISEIESKNLANYFKEFKSEIENCEFIDCSHLKEENCGIKKALEQGKISKDRYNRFCKIYQELKEKEDNKKW